MAEQDPLAKYTQEALKLVFTTFEQVSGAEQSYRMAKGAFDGLAKKLDKEKIPYLRLGDTVYGIKKVGKTQEGADIANLITLQMTEKGPKIIELPVYAYALVDHIVKAAKKNPEIIKKNMEAINALGYGEVLRSYGLS